MNIDIDYSQFKRWLVSTLKPAGFYIQGDSNIIENNYSDNGSEIIGDKNMIRNNISAWFMVKGNYNEIIGNRIIENLQKFSRQDLEQLLVYLDKPSCNQYTIKDMLKRLFSGISIKGGVSLVNIPGLPSFYIEIEKQIT